MTGALVKGRLEGAGRFIRSRAFFGGAQALLLAAALWLRIMSFATRDLWIDETEQLGAVSNRGFFSLLKYLSEIPGGFPGDYFLTYPFAHLSLNKWVISIPHFLSMALTFYLFYRIWRDFFSGKLGYLVALACLTFNKTLVFHALEFRPYGTFTMVVLLQFWLTGHLRAIAEHGAPRGRGLWLLFGALGTAFTCLFHAFGPLAVLGSAAYFVATWRPFPSVNRLWKFAFPILLGGLLILPLYYHFAKPMQSFNIDPFYYIPCSLVGLWKVIAILCGSRPFYVFLPVLVAAFFMKGYLRERLSLLVFMVAIPLAAILINDLRNQYWFIQRQFVWTMPFFAIFLGVSVQAVWEKAVAFRQGTGK